MCLVVFMEAFKLVRYRWQELVAVGMEVALRVKPLRHAGGEAVVVPPGPSSLDFPTDEWD